MLNLLAQAATDFTTNTQPAELSSGEAAGFALFGGVFLIIWLTVLAVMVVSMWKIFEKAGRPGWAAIVPIYNGWVAAEIAGYPGWYALAFLLSFIPIVGPIVSLVVAIILSIGLVKSFGKDPVWAALLLLVPVVGYPMLAFGDAKYVGPKPLEGTTPDSFKKA